VAPETSELTVREAAQRLGVHYMTAYGYVRTGRLEARREGAEWRIRRQAVDRMLEPPVRRGRSATSALAERLAARLVANDERGAWTLIERALISGREPADIHLDVITPAMRWIGEQWQQGRLDISDEHGATTVAQRLVARLGPRFTPAGRTSGTIVLGCVTGERHALASALLADLLRSRRFAVVDLGGDTPPESFVTATRVANRPRAVLVGALCDGRDAEVAATLAALRAADLDVPLLAGGAGISGGEAAHGLGADAWTGHDGHAALAAVATATGGRR
jgi:excisionase family DNA binding protein